MDYAELVDAHVDRHADITIAAQPVDADDAPRDGHLPRSIATARSSRSRRSRTRDRLAADRPEHPARRRRSAGARAGQAVRRLDGHLRLLARRAARHARARTAASTSAARSSRRALGRYRGAAVPASGGYWADVGHHRVVLRRQHHAHAARRAVPVLRSARRPIYTHPRFLPERALQRLHGRDAIMRRGLLPRSAARSKHSVVGIRTVDPRRARASRRLGPARRRLLRRR